MNSKDSGATNTFEYVLSGVEGAMGNRIVPPGPERDRSGPERERYRERQRERLKGKAGDITRKCRSSPKAARSRSRLQAVMSRPGVLAVMVMDRADPEQVSPVAMRVKSMR